VRAFAATLGCLEILAALLIAIRPLAPRISVIGSAMGILLFLSTLSFLFTTPGVAAGSGFPVLSVLPGQFLLKDLVLVSASRGHWATPSAPPCHGAARIAVRNAPDRGRQRPIRLVTVTMPQLVRARRTDDIRDRSGR
jgi:hypothetical protein